jgi:hypothetical protein
MGAMRTLIALALFATACGSSTPASAPPTSKPPATEETTQPPFDAGALRDAFQVGLTLRYQITQEGHTRVEQWQVTAADAETCTLNVKIFSADGNSLIEDTGDHTSKWTELENHGRFPAARTTRTDSSIDVPAGHFETWQFVVAPGSSTESARTLHFARNLPGPPVWLEFKQGDLVVNKMELLSRTGPGPATLTP